MREGVCVLCGDNFRDFEGHVTEDIGPHHMTDLHCIETLRMKLRHALAGWSVDAPPISGVYWISRLNHLGRWETELAEVDDDCYYYYLFGGDALGYKVAEDTEEGAMWCGPIALRQPEAPIR